MKKSNELRQKDWPKANYDVSDGQPIVTSHSELRGDSTPKEMGHHGSAKGRRDHMSSVANQVPFILDRDPAKETKPWASGPAEAKVSDGFAHWTEAEDGPTQIAQPKSGELSHPPASEPVHRSWKKRGYDMSLPTALPAGELASKWKK
jgi:hypothetical protein